MKRNCGLWTITLTDGDYIALSASGKWPEFQSRVHDLLVRYLKAHGDGAFVVGICEVGPERFARTGRPDPHIHLVTSGWGRRGPDGQWLLKASVMDELVAKACQYVGLPSAHRPSASRIEPIKHSVAKYLSKYLTKNLPIPVDQLEGEHSSLIPRQWWFRSASCKALLEGCVINLPPAFAAFVSRCHMKLEGLGLGRGGYAVVARRETLLGEIPIELLKFRFKGTDELLVAIELFLIWVTNDEELDVSQLAMSG